MHSRKLLLVALSAILLLRSGLAEKDGGDYLSNDDECDRGITEICSNGMLEALCKKEEICHYLRSSMSGLNETGIIDSSIALAEKRKYV